MRLFHVSEEPDIEIFNPRIPDRCDMDKSVGLVWAVDEQRLPNFLFPRNCPRVTYHINKNTTLSDKAEFFTSPQSDYCGVIENSWFNAMCSTTLYLYEFDTAGFELQDNVAGYYVSKTVQKPVAKHTVTDLFSELFKRNVEIRLVENLWDIADKVKKSSLNWSLCRMGYAKPKKDVRSWDF